MYEIYCKETNAIIWKTNSYREARTILKEQEEYHKNDTLTFAIRLIF